MFRNGQPCTVQLQAFCSPKCTGYSRLGYQFCRNRCTFGEARLYVFSPLSEVAVYVLHGNDPPSYVVKMKDGHEVGTERNSLSRTHSSPFSISTNPMPVVTFYNFNNLQIRTINSILPSEQIGQKLSEGGIHILKPQNRRA